MKKRVFRLDYSKKSQVTVFIILGIVLVLAVGTVIYISGQTQREILEPGVIPALSDIPSEFDPIRTYVQDCVERIAAAGLKQLGENGGYIYPDDVGLIVIPEFPTESDAIQFSPKSDLKVAYWWYLKAPNDCEGNCLFSSMRPPLYRKDGSDSIENQLDEFIAEQLPVCLNNFLPFVEQGYSITPIGDVNPSVTIANEDIAVVLDYELEVSRGDLTGTISDYFVRIPLNFKQIYEFASEISNAEIKYQFLEKHTMNLISVFSAVDDNKLPPIGDTDITYDATTWSSLKVKSDIEDMLMVYVPFFQVYNTRNYIRRLTTGGTQSMYEHMEIPINLDGTYDDYSASFSYLKWWPIYFDVNSRGDLIMPESMNNPILPIFGVQRYVTAYDVSYPVIVEVSDPDAFYGDGYTLRFAMETNIRNNEPIDESFEGLEGVRVFEKSLFCNYNQRNSGEVTIDAVDALTNKGISNIQIMYTCGDETCVIGATDNNGRLQSKFPICSNGIVSFGNYDYFAPVEILSTSLDEDKDMLVKLYPFIEKDIRIKKFSYSSRFNQLGINPINIYSNERAIISMNKIKDSVREADVMAFAQYEGNDTKLRLVPGRYSANINMFVDQRIYIPEETRKIDVGLIGSLAGVEDEYTVPAIEFNESYPIGGAIFNANTGLLNIDADNLYKDNVLEIYVIGHEIPTKLEDVELITGLEEQTARFRSSLEPAYVK